MAKVLIVDDAEMNAEVLSEIVQMMGLTTKLAANGKEAVDLVRDEKFDLIFMDHLMPVMDGLEAFAVIKKEKLAPGTPVIMVTANDSAADGSMYLDAGFSDYMKKPFSAEIIKNMLIKYGLITQNEDEKLWNELEKNLKGISLDETKAYCLYDPSFYLEILGAYLEIDMLPKDKSKKGGIDIENLLFDVRNAKDSARLIGAKELAGEALLMEENIRSDDEEGFALHLERYQQLEKKLRKVVRKAENLKNSYSC